MYQLEVKRWLVQHRFNPGDGWDVTVDVDAMERGHGGQHAADKAERAASALTALVGLGARIEAHADYGRADLVAVHPAYGAWLVEVEGKSSRQSEQAMYSALGQLVLQLRERGVLHLAIAVPDLPAWERHLSKIPAYAREVFGLACILVSEDGCRTLTEPVALDEFRSGGTVTTKVGFVNRNGQRCDGHRGAPGTDHMQTAYRMTCTAKGCGAVYGANGSDVFQRRCPLHQGGAPGLSF